MVRNILVRGIVPAEIVVAVGEVDVRLVENGSPLEGRGVKSLTSRAMAVLGRKRLVSAQLICDFSTVT